MGCVEAMRGEAERNIFNLTAPCLIVSNARLGNSEGRKDRNTSTGVVKLICVNAMEWKPVHKYVDRLKNKILDRDAAFIAKHNSSCRLLLGWGSFYLWSSALCWHRFRTHSCLPAASLLCLFCCFFFLQTVGTCFKSPLDASLDVFFFTDKAGPSFGFKCTYTYIYTYSMGQVLVHLKLPMFFFLSYTLIGALAQDIPDGFCDAPFHKDSHGLGVHLYQMHFHCINIGPYLPSKKTVSNWNKMYSNPL